MGIASPIIQQIHLDHDLHSYDDMRTTVAHSEKEVCQLIKAGFEFVCDHN